MASFSGFALLQAKLNPPQPDNSAAELCAPYSKFHGNLAAFDRAVEFSDDLGCNVYGMTWLKGGGFEPDPLAKVAAMVVLERRYPKIPTACASKLIDDGFLRYLVATDESHKTAAKFCIALATKSEEARQYEAQQRETERQLREK